MESPLEEVNPRSLDEVFNSSPLTHSKEDRALIIAELRAQRAKWAQAEAEGKRAPRPKAPAKPKLSSEELKNLSLDDLFK